MLKQDATERGTGFFKKNLETMPHKKRIEYLNRRLRGIIQYANKHSVVLRSKFLTTPRGYGKVGSIIEWRSG
jgi:hypothetical protein